MRRKIFFSHKEELWNSWSHSGGIVLGVVFGTIFLVWCSKERSGWATVGVILYLVGMLFSYITSTVYHALSAHSVWKERLRKWDHAAIYWHIAGSYFSHNTDSLAQSRCLGDGACLPLYGSVQYLAPSHPSVNCVTIVT